MKVKVIGHSYDFPYYHMGLNTLEEQGKTSQTEKDIRDDGIVYYDIVYVYEHLLSGDQVCIVEPSPDARVVQIDAHYKTDKLIIKEMMDLNDVKTHQFLRDNDAEVNDTGAFDYLLAVAMDALGNKST